MKKAKGHLVATDELPPAAQAAAYDLIVEREMRMSLDHHNLPDSGLTRTLVYAMCLAAEGNIPASAAVLRQIIDDNRPDILRQFIDKASTLHPDIAAHFQTVSDSALKGFVALVRTSTSGTVH